MRFALFYCFLVGRDVLDAPSKLIISLKSSRANHTYLWLVDRCLWQQYPTSPPCLKNSTPYCFSKRQTLTGSTPKNKKQEETQPCGYISSCFGAGGGGRTRTVSLPTDFESASSANSNTPAGCFSIIYNLPIKIKSYFCFCSRARLTPPNS